MRFFFILFLSLLFIGCNAEHHLAKSKKHLNKAIQKGAVIKTEIDTVYLNQFKTVYDTILKDSIKLQIKTVTIHEKGQIRYVSKRDKREEKRLSKLLAKYRFKLSKDSLAFVMYKAKQENRTARTVVRQENKKSNWWIWLIVGLIVGFLLRTLMKIYLHL